MNRLVYIIFYAFFISGITNIVQYMVQVIVSYFK